MLAHAGSYWLEIKQLPFCFTASRFSATPSPAEPQTAQWADFVEQMNNCGLICFLGKKKKVLKQLINRRLRSAWRKSKWGQIGDRWNVSLFHPQSWTQQAGTCEWSQDSSTRKGAESFFALPEFGITFWLSFKIIFKFILYSFTYLLFQNFFQSGSDDKKSAYNAEDLGWIPGLGRFPGEGNGCPLQYFCLENSIDREAWKATVHGVTKGQIWLRD